MNNRLSPAHAAIALAIAAFLLLFLIIPVVTVVYVAFLFVVTRFEAEGQLAGALVVLAATGLDFAARRLAARRLAKRELPG